MDHIDSQLATDASDNKYPLSIKAALAMGKKTLNQYYCTISTECSRVVTCDTRCSLEQVFTRSHDLWHEPKVFISSSVHSFEGVAQESSSVDCIRSRTVIQRCTHTVETHWQKKKRNWSEILTNWPSVHNWPWPVTMASSVQFTRPCDLWHEHLVEMVQYNKTNYSEIFQIAMGILSHFNQFSLGCDLWPHGQNFGFGHLPNLVVLLT
jgi:hypothetical protein